MPCCSSSRRSGESANVLLPRILAAMAKCIPAERAAILLPNFQAAAFYPAAFKANIEIAKTAKQAGSVAMLKGRPSVLCAGMRRGTPISARCIWRWEARWSTASRFRWASSKRACARIRTSSTGSRTSIGRQTASLTCPQ